VATYGIDYYGRGYYGNVSLANFDANPFTAAPLDYGKIYLQWNTPTGNYSGIRLVRNGSGFPQTADDGDVLVDGSYGTVANDFYDPSPYGYDGTLPMGKFFYYSIFVSDTDTGQWVRAANAAGLSVKNYGTPDAMYDYLPGIYKTTDITAPVDTSDNPILSGFLKIFGFYYDMMRTEIDNITSRYDVANLSGNLIPGLMQQFGIQYEPELGLARGRSFLSNVVHINKTKGSLAGVQDYVKSFTGNAGIVTLGKNLMLDINDSSAEQSIGSWTVTNATITQHVPQFITSWSVSASTSSSTLTVTVPSTAEFSTGNTIEIYGTTLINGTYTLTGTTTSTVSMVTATPFPTAQSGTGGQISKHAPYNETANPYGVQNGRNGEFKITATGTSAITGTCLNTSVAIAVGNDTTTTYYQSPTSHSIGVSASTEYTLSYRAWSYATARSFKAGINWYDRTGTIIGSTALGSATTSTTTSWTTISVTATSPSNAVFAIPVFTIASPTANEVHFLDAFQFEAGGSVTYFQESRLVQIAVAANRINLFVNPNFEYSTNAPWTATNGTLITQSDTVVPNSSPNIAISSSALELHNSSTSAVTLSSAATSADYMPVLSNETYTFSGYFFMSPDDGAPAPQGIYFKTIWYDSSNTLISSSFSQTFTVSTTEWNRFSFTTASPNNAASCKFQVVWPAPTTTGIAILMDAFLFEASAYVDSFFDGSFGYADLGDVTWKGTPNQSPSYYYRNRFATQNRVNETLPNYLMIGTNFATYYAQA